ncbi:MAG: GNAT family N-acetyltransferase [Paracoccaceae bacterium]
MIRRGEPADFSTVADLQIASWRDAYRDNLSEEYLGQQIVDDLQEHWGAMVLGGGDILLVSENGGALDGFIMILGRVPPYVDNLHILPSARRSGIGAALMRAGAAALLALGETRVWLTVITDNDRAVSFYEAMGATRGPEQANEMFGQPVAAYPMVWDDLAALAAG